MKLFYFYFFCFFIFFNYLNLFNENIFFFLKENFVIQEKGEQETNEKGENNKESNKETIKEESMEDSETDESYEEEKKRNTKKKNTKNENNNTKKMRYSKKNSSSTNPTPSSSNNSPSPSSSSHSMTPNSKSSVLSKRFEAPKKRDYDDLEEEDWDKDDSLEKENIPKQNVKKIDRIFPSSSSSSSSSSSPTSSSSSSSNRIKENIKTDFSPRNVKRTTRNGLKFPNDDRGNVLDQSEVAEGNNKNKKLEKKNKNKKIPETGKNIKNKNSNNNNNGDNIENNKNENKEEIVYNTRSRLKKTNPSSSSSSVDHIINFEALQNSYNDEENVDDNLVPSSIDQNRNKNKRKLNSSKEKKSNKNSNVLSHLSNDNKILTNKIIIPKEKNGNAFPNKNDRKKINTLIEPSIPVENTTSTTPTFLINKKRKMKSDPTSDTPSEIPNSNQNIRFKTVKKSEFSFQNKIEYDPKIQNFIKHLIFISTHSPLTNEIKNQFFETFFLSKEQFSAKSVMECIVSDFFDRKWIVGQSASKFLYLYLFLFIFIYFNLFLFIFIYFNLF